MEQLPSELFGEIGKYLRYIEWCQLKVICGSLYNRLGYSTAPKKQSSYKTIKYLLRNYSENGIVELIKNSEEEVIMVNCRWIRLFFSGNSNRAIMGHATVYSRDKSVWIKNTISADIQSVGYTDGLENYVHYCVKYGKHKKMLRKVHPDYPVPYYIKYGNDNFVDHRDGIYCDDKVSYFMGRHYLMFSSYKLENLDWAQMALGAIRYNNKDNYEIAVSNMNFSIITSNMAQLLKKLLEIPDSYYMKIVEQRGLDKEFMEIIVSK